MVHFLIFSRCPVFLFCWRVAIREKTKIKDRWPVFPFSTILAIIWIAHLMVVKALAPFSHKNSWQMFIPPYHPVILTKLHGCYANPVWWFTYHKWWFSIANCDRLPDGLVCLRNEGMWEIGGLQPPLCGLSFISPLKLSQDATHAAFFHREQKRLEKSASKQIRWVLWKKNISNIVSNTVRTVRKCQENTSPQRNK